MLCLGATFAHRRVRAVNLGFLAMQAFQEKVGNVAKRSSLPNPQFQKAAPKTFSRAAHKIVTDYRYDEKPRCASSIDTIRNRVVLDNAAELLDFYSALVEEFDGVAKMKNHFVLGRQERRGRFNLVSLVATVLFDTGLTFGELVNQTSTQTIWDAYCSRPDGQPLERWKRHTLRARTFLESPHVALQKVVALGEVQLLLPEHARVRHQIQEPLLVYRAEDQHQLHTEFLRAATDTEADEDAVDVYSAAYWGQRDVVARLLDSGHAVDTVGQESHGRTAVSVAAERGHADVVVLLLQRNANVHTPDGTGVNPLHCSAQNGHLDIAKLLLRAKADVNPTSEGKLSPLCCAARSGYFDVAELFVSQGADVNRPELGNGASPAYIAAYNGHEGILKLLVNASADVHQQEPMHGGHPLHAAAMNNHPRTARACLDLKADIDKPNFEASTPLFVAAERGHLDVVRVLVGYSADESIPGPDGETPLAVAEAKGFERVAAYLRDGDEAGILEGLDMLHFPETPLQERARLRKGKLAKLLPGEKPPPEVQLCLKKEWGGYATVTHQERIKATIDWLVDALCSAYLDRTIKATACQLLREHGYTANLAFASSLAPLKNDLENRLADLGAQLDNYYDENDLGKVLGDEAVGSLTRYHPLVAASNQKLSQAAVLPSPKGFFDFSDARYRKSQNIACMV